MNLITIACAILLSTSCPADEAHVVHMANGVKIGEVTSTTGIIWTRLTARADYMSDGPEFQKLQLDATSRSKNVDSAIAGPERGYGRQVPHGFRLGDMRTSVPGASGQLDLRYWPENERASAVSVDWTPVDAARDFTHQFQLRSLRPGTRYEFVVRGRSSTDAAARQLCEIPSEPLPEKTPPRK